MGVRVDGTMVLVGAVAAAGVGIYLARGRLFGALDKINPASRENVVYQGTNKAGKAISGDEGFNLGVKIWEWMNPRQAAIDEQIAGGGDVDVVDVPDIAPGGGFGGGLRDPHPPANTGMRNIDQPVVLY